MNLKTSSLTCCYLSFLSEAVQPFADSIASSGSASATIKSVTSIRSSLLKPASLVWGPGFDLYGLSTRRSVRHECPVSLGFAFVSNFRALIPVSVGLAAS